MIIHRISLLAALIAGVLLGNTLQSNAATRLQIDVEGWTGFEDPIPISVSGYTGEVLETLTFDLYVQGFTIVSADKADYTLTGRNTSRVEGRLTSRVGGGAELVAKAYSGASMRQQAHALADDVVKAVRGIDGIGRTKIAFRVEKTKRHREIYVADYDGSRPQAATSDGALVAAPTWVPGKNILLYTSYKNTFPDIYWHDLSTGQRKIIASHDGNNYSPAVSPDGRKVAMILGITGRTELWVADINGGNLLQLTRTRGTEASPTWSADSKTICFSSDEGGQSALYTVSATGGTMQRLSGAFGLCTEPDWSPNSRWIAYTRQSGNSFTIWVLDTTTGQARELVPGQDPSWAPNSRNLIYLRGGSGLSVLDVPTKQSKDIARVSGKSTQPSWAR